MILYNPTNVEQSFLYGGYPYVFKPKESKTLSDEIGIWCIKKRRGNTNLVEYNHLYDKEMLTTDMDYEKMRWQQVISLASARKLFRPGKHFTKEELFQKLRDYDTQAGIISKPPDQKEGEGSSGPSIL